MPTPVVRPYFLVEQQSFAINETEPNEAQHSCAESFGHLGLDESCNLESDAAELCPLMPAHVDVPLPTLSGRQTREPKRVRLAELLSGQRRPYRHYGGQEEDIIDSQASFDIAAQQSAGPPSCFTSPQKLLKDQKKPWLGSATKRHRF